MSRDPQRSLPPAILLMGPTASGKTAVVQALARSLPVEVVSVDSAQVYRDMDIGTAKPTPAELAECPHHLIDLISPEESYSAARFRADAIRLIADIAARGRVPLLAGGTMLYFKALREGLSSLPAADPVLRLEIEARAAAQGWPALHAELAARDPQAAARLEPNDAQRIQRALEIVLLTGAPLAASYARREHAPLPFRPVAIALLPSVRSALHERIARRFDDMLARGLIEEVEQLRSRYGLHPQLPSMRCVGYRQVWDYLEGNCDRQTLRDKGIFATRQLAKRQLTWLRSFRDVAEFDCLDGRLAERVEGHLQRTLDG
jgi:tRNA dimethylallyltransferase